MRWRLATASETHGSGRACPALAPSEIPMKLYRPYRTMPFETSVGQRVPAMQLPRPLCVNQLRLPQVQNHHRGQLRQTQDRFCNTTAEIARAKRRMLQTRAAQGLGVQARHVSGRGLQASSSGQADAMPQWHPTRFEAYP